MRVLFVTSEVASLFKLGGLADVSDSLPRALSRLGVKVDIALPFYSAIKTSKTQSLGQLGVEFERKREIVFLFTTTIGKEGVRVILFRHPRLNDYHSQDITETFAFYSQAVVAYINYTASIQKNFYHVIHCHDWHTALVPLLLGESNKVTREKETLQSRATKTVLTIHNLLYQGAPPETLAHKLGLLQNVFHPQNGDKEKSSVNFLLEGIEYADIVSTVSPTYAREILTPEHGQHLSRFLKRRPGKVLGLLNGIDVDHWDPKRDSQIALNYSAKTATAAKVQNKAALQKRLKLPIRDVPLLAFIGRLEAAQKGIDILIGALGKLLPQESMQMVILGVGNSEVVAQLERLAGRFPEKLAPRNEFNDSLAHQIYAGATAIVIPSKFEPCGLVQMIAMRYGAIPIVRRTGGLADTVKDGVTGLIFRQYSAKDLSLTIERGLRLRYEKPLIWEKLVTAAMRENFSWDKSGRKYSILYQKLVAKKAK